jgi:hypothetical protein
LPRNLNNTTRTFGELVLTQEPANPLTNQDESPTGLEFRSLFVMGLWMESG